MNPYESQVGGQHYKEMAIQPAHFIHQNGIGFLAGCAIKYLCRYKRKNGREDLEKSRHFIQLLIEEEYPKEMKSPMEVVAQTEPIKGSTYKDQPAMTERETRLHNAAQRVLFLIKESRQSNTSGLAQWVDTFEDVLRDALEER